MNTLDYLNYIELLATTLKIDAYTARGVLGHFLADGIVSDSTLLDDMTRYDIWHAYVMGGIMHEVKNEPLFAQVIAYLNGVPGFPGDAI